eukprot:TRINITY_DN253_c0_g1_i1.p1 TRINITY_DN253_c0_g1~~TRINITY_DN253_c0_g1_i1.p1  ORF type:complete len:127 (+),score=11.91 TRINITY_DN253_c0_g1_i1:113-493(+)
MSSSMSSMLNSYQPSMKRPELEPTPTKSIQRSPPPSATKMSSFQSSIFNDMDKMQIHQELVEVNHNLSRLASALEDLVNIKQADIMKGKLVKQLNKGEQGTTLSRHVADYIDEKEIADPSKCKGHE